MKVDEKGTIKVNPLRSLLPLRCPYCYWFLVENVNSDGWVCENPSCRKIFKKR